MTIAVFKSLISVFISQKIFEVKNIFNILIKVSANIGRMAETGKVPLFLEKENNLTSQL